MTDLAPAGPQPTTARRARPSGVAALLTDSFERVRQVADRVVADLTPEELVFRPAPDANSIAWLVWHLTRIQDDHVSAVMDRRQVWTAQHWAEQFALPLPWDETGFGHDADEVAAVRVESGHLLRGYLRAVSEQTASYVRTLTDDDLGRVVDEGFDPPVTLGVRLVSVVADDLQHAGQAAYVRGLIHPPEVP